MNLTLTLPKIATYFTTQNMSCPGGGNCGWLANKPLIKITSSNSNVEAYADLMKNDGYDLFTGTIMNGSTYKFYISADAINGYYLANNLLVTINGQKVTQFDYAVSEYFGFIYRTKITGKKLNNPMTVSTKTKTVKYKDVKKKKQVVTPITVKNAGGKVTYAKQKGSSSYLTINKNTGLITVKKKTAKGTYKIKEADIKSQPLML